VRALLKPHDPQHRDRWWEVPFHGFFRLFNFGFDKFASGYGWIVGQVVRFAAIMLIVYAAILAYGLNEFRKTPTGSSRSSTAASSSWRRSFRPAPRSRAPTR
jgi:multidrug efflux pump subunit AcrB